MPRPFKMDDGTLQTCLGEDGFSIDCETRKMMRQSIEETVKWYCSETAARKVTLRQKYDSLRELTMLAEKGAPEALRKKLDQLSPAVIAELDRFADSTLLSLFPTPAISARPSKQIKKRRPLDAGQHRPIGPGHRITGGVKKWAATATPDQLAKGIHALASSGGAIVPGRKRNNGKQSRSRVEPRIMGIVRGLKNDGRDTEKGGRPSNADFTLLIIGQIAYLWERATGGPPKAKRRHSSSGFAALVDAVFDDAGLQADGQGVAEYGLRCFFDEMKKL